MLTFQAVVVNLSGAESVQLIESVEVLLVALVAVSVTDTVKGKSLLEYPDLLITPLVVYVVAIIHLSYYPIILENIRSSPSF